MESRSNKTGRSCGTGTRRVAASIDYRDLGGLDGADLDVLIARQVRVFAERGMRFEWKYFAHDLPVDLPERLAAAGLEPEEVEAVMIAQVAAIAAAPRVPDGVTLAEVTAREDFDRITAMEETIWGDRRAWLADMLESERAVDPEALTVVVAEAADAIVCAGWIRFHERHRVRLAVGRRNAAGVARPRDLPGVGGLSCGSGGVARHGLPVRRRLTGQPADPRAARVRRGHHDDAIRLVAPRRLRADGPVRGHCQGGVVRAACDSSGVCEARRRALS